MRTIIAILALIAFVAGASLSTVGALASGAICFDKRTYSALKKYKLTKSCFEEKRAEICALEKCGYEKKEEDLDRDQKTDHVFQILIEPHVAKNGNLVERWGVFVRLSSVPDLIQIPLNVNTSIPEKDFVRFVPASVYGGSKDTKAIVIGFEDIFSVYVYDVKKGKFVLIHQVVD